MRILLLQLLFVVRLFAQPTMDNYYTTQSAPSIVDGLRNESVIVSIQLSDYKNPNLELAEAGQNCRLISDSNLSKCHFIFLITTDSESDVKQPIYSKPYVPDMNGNILTDQFHGTNNIFNRNLTMRFQIRPTQIKITVYHIGVILGENQKFIEERGVADAGTFVVRLLGENRSWSGSVQDTGRQHSSLLVSYSISCSSSLTGPNCDLLCNRSVSEANVALCKQRNTGFFSICQYITNNEVSNCHSCPWGIGNESYCKDENGGVLEIAGAGVTGKSFRTATIILGVIAGVLLLLLIIVTIYSCIVVNKKRKSEENDAPGFNYHSQLRAEGNANRPLLQASYTAQSPSVQSDSFQRLPTTNAPRFQPSLDAVPAKSSLRKTNYVPAAHVGGTSSINDTLNSSFASSVPIPPSREADV
uniref:LAM_G_DOMAIN domain-containing protein n=1 Tax=Syphacia muris TaxID=451379 RepID=A0A0N5AG20_9BILA